MSENSGQKPHRSRVHLKLDVNKLFAQALEAAQGQQPHVTTVTTTPRLTGGAPVRGLLAADDHEEEDDVVDDDDDDDEDE